MADPMFAMGRLRRGMGWLAARPALAMCGRMAIGTGAEAVMLGWTAAGNVRRGAEPDGKHLTGDRKDAAGASEADAGVN